MMNLTEYRRTASRLADYLPWVALVGSGIVLNKDGSFQRTAKFRGPDLDSAVAAELVAVAGRLNNAFRRLGSGWAIFVEAQRSEAATYPASRFPDPASALVDAERKADFEEEGSHFVSGYFLTFLCVDAFDRDATRTGEVVGHAVIPLAVSVLLEPGDGKAGVGVELALDAAKIFVEFPIDQLQRGLDAHRAVVGFQHGLVAREDAHAGADGRLRHVGRGDVGSLKLGNGRGQFAF